MADKSNFILRAGAGCFDRLWAYRRELAPVGLLAVVWVGASWTLPWRAAVAVTAVAAASLLAGLVVGPTRRWLLGWIRCGRTWRQVLAGMTATRAANVHGKLPRVRRVERTAFGERLHLRARPGQSKELLELRVPELRVAAKAMTVRIARDPVRSNRITLDVVRLDPLASVGDVAWEGLGAESLSMWDLVHLGVTETGEPVRVSFVERSLLVGGWPGAGKSTFLRLIAAHAAKSPDAQLVVIDPNRVQFSPWRERALVYAAQDQDDALEALGVVLDELDRRLDILESLPGHPEKITREISEANGLPLMVVMIDEIAYHTAGAPNAEKRARFSSAMRDLVSRCRAAGIIVVVATQRPTDKVVPRDLADLFSMRAAFSVKTPANSDVILGDAMVKNGYNAAEIPLEMRGIGLLLTEGDWPVKFKSARIPSELVGDLARSTVRFRPGGAKPRLHVVGARVA
jgi:S-DNA-T family DNA segregation ATPase FtsK/SpoIIIE